MKTITLILASTLLATGVNACKNSGTKNESLVGSHWKLIELSSLSVAPSLHTPEPYIVLDSTTLKFNGNAGCNTFVGSYKLGKEGKITFSQVVSTRMMCLDMDIENQFLKIFESIGGYQIKGNTLTFLNDSGTPLARFKNEQ